MEAVVIGVGCRRCRRLARMTQEALAKLGAGDVVLRNVDDLEDMADLGPILTPALVLGGALLVSGRLPSQRYLTRLIRDELRRQV